MSLAEVMGRKRLLPPSLGGSVLLGFAPGGGFFLTPLQAGRSWALFLGLGLFPSEMNLKSCVAALTQFSGDCLPRLLAGSDLTHFNSAWKGICRAPHQNTCTAALAAFLALRAINKICHLN